MDELKFPNRNTRFELEDFFQTEVDDFHSGEFLFLSAKKIKTKSNEKLFEDIESVDEYGWVVSTWCYTCRRYFKIFICQYKQKAWKNHYHIENLLTGLNACDSFGGSTPIKDFIEWIRITK